MRPDDVPWQRCSLPHLQDAYHAILYDPKTRDRVQVYKNLPELSGFERNGRHMPYCVIYYFNKRDQFAVYLEDVVSFYAHIIDFTSEG
jgi:hypothetical protein